jgi:hypothetical protein
LVLTGFISSVGYTEPLTIRITASTTDDFYVHRCEMYRAYLPTIDLGAATLAASGSTYLGFTEYDFTGADNDGSRFFFPTAPNELVKVCFWAKMATTGDLGYLKTSDLTDVCHSTPVTDEWNFFELTAGTVGSRFWIQKRAGQAMKIAGIAVVFAYPTGIGRAMRAAQPTEGWYRAGDLVQNEAPGAFGWMCLTSGRPGTWHSLASYAARGSATLVAGTVAVANTSITANSIIKIWRYTAGGTLGHLSYVNNAGVGFTINSDNAADTSVIRYQIDSY